MKFIQLSDKFITNEHCNFYVDEEGVVVESKHSFHDVWINCPEVETLWWLAPDPRETNIGWNEEMGFLIPAKNDPKEFSAVNCNRMAFKSLKGSGKIYLLIQRN